MTDERLLRSSLAFVWLATAVTCVHPFYQRIGAEYLHRLSLAPFWMFVACALEAVLGGIVLAQPLSRPLLVAQIAAIAGFTIVVAWLEPMMIVSPFGMLSKNIPFVLVAWAAYRLRQEPLDTVVPLLRVAAALPWLTEGLFPKLLFQQNVELSMAPAIGITFASPSVVVGTLGVLQIATFVLAFALRGTARQLLLAGQLLALVALPLVIGWIAPWLWVHPFGAFSKNAPIIAATWVVFRRGRA